MTKEALIAAREALKSAQEYIEAELKDRIDLYGSYPNLAYKYATEQRDLDENVAALALIDTALAQTEQEPVAWRTKESDEKKPKHLDDWFYAENPAYVKAHKFKWQPLYAAPVAQPEQMLVEALKSPCSDWKHRDVCKAALASAGESPISSA